MKQGMNILFPVVMVLGLVLSTLVIANSLQAATMPVVASESAGAKANLDAAVLVAPGRNLFIAKGCIVCHRNDNAMSSSAREFEFGDIPNLTTLRINEDYLRRWLHDPQSIKPGTEMPNLNLTDNEVDALAAFLTSAGNKQ